jgi:hypothetical protein
MILPPKIVERVAVAGKRRRLREMKKIPRLQALRHAVVEPEMIHQAGGSWGGIVGDEG